jgi:lipopolysaccharide/colanic/teichoic acid biosynthesis glycosyltransferase
MKRILDFFSSAVLVMFLSPVIFLIGVIVFVSMGRPVLFTQVRPGLKGKPFRIYKFRTMNNLADQSGNMLSDEMRLTGVGRFLRRLSIDELPQLFNVVKGDLSFVGPRPLLMEYLPLYTPDQARRHDVRPGITGWAQINGRNVITWEERFNLDVWYVDHNSLRLDIEILLRTVFKVLKGEGISAEGYVTMPKFTGSRTEG